MSKFSKVLFFILMIQTVSLSAQTLQLKGTVTLSGAWAIYPTAVSWADDFHKLYPDVTVNISAGGAGKGAADVIAGLVDIGMVSREPDQAELSKGIVPIYVLHDAVFAVVNERNPVLQTLLNNGLPKRDLMEIFIQGTKTDWGDFVKEETKKPIHVYTRSDSCGAASAWAGYFGKKQEDIKGIGIYGDPGLLEAVVRDPMGIGFSNFSYVFTRNGSVLKGIRLVPIDADGSGNVDENEVFTDRGQAVKAIESGKYPVTRRNYFFVMGKPQGLTKEFIKFVLSEAGTKVVNEVGTSLPLPSQEREKILATLE